MQLQVRGTESSITISNAEPTVMYTSHAYRAESVSDDIIHQVVLNSDVHTYMYIIQQL